MLICLFFSCRNNTEKDPVQENRKDKHADRTETVSSKEYRNEEWNLSLEYPDNYRVLESRLPGNSPVINIYPENIAGNPPFAIHENPDISYIAILPRGFGVDAPGGLQSSFLDSAKTLDLNVGFDKKQSKIYQLKNGDTWAYLLKFQDLPSTWDQYGNVFIHFAIENFKSKCIDPNSGEEKEMSECDPMGNDEVIYSGEINEQSKEEILQILRSLKFENKDKKQISELIKVEQPLPNIDVSSPLVVKGLARGYWFFEASAPIEILDKDFKKIAEGHIKAQGKWMTEDFVDFKGVIEFDAPDDERGYLLFKKANPSGKKENDREYRIPIIFPPK